MSTQRKPEFIEELISEDAVDDYLEANPDFFERHGELLSSLRLPHGSGATVSLVERQVSVLRQKDMKLERKLKDLIEVARVNDALGTKMHQLTLQLLATIVVLATLAPNISADAPSYIDERYYEMMFARRVRQFGEWALDRPSTTLIVTTDAGHAVFRDDPDLATEAVRRVVARVSANR